MFSHSAPSSPTERRGTSLLTLALAMLLVAAPSLAQQPAAAPARTRSDSARAFGALVASLSEAGGYFDTDNLISNERSYLHVMSGLDRLGVRGGGYIGVGPDQNFSYIARIKPSIAFIVDVRRDNLLQQLMFKALFARARNRAEYLALWLGKPLPDDVAALSNANIDAIVARLDALTSTPISARAAHAAVQDEVQRFGIPLSTQDLATIERFHAAFIASGLSLQFTSTGRRPREYYPTLRQLILERDLNGVQASYLARETDFQFVKSLEARDLVVPVVGDLGGTKAMRAIGALLTQRGERLSALYASNAEDYVMRGGGFARYAKSVLAMPRDAKSVFIRSWFGGEGSHPQNVRGYYSTQLLQTIDDFAGDFPSGAFPSYYDLTHRRTVPLR